MAVGASVTEALRWLDLTGVLWPLLDALALGCWAAAGAQKTLAYGLGWLPAVLLGTITAVGGGFVRDVVLGRIPGILGGNTLYATCAPVASAVMVVLYRAHQPTAGSIAATLVGAGLCLLARWQHWVLPQGADWSALGALRRREFGASRRSDPGAEQPERPEQK